MERTELLQLIGFSSVAVVVLAWLLASFKQPGPGQLRAARLGAAGLYLALCSLFTHLSLQAWEAGSWLVLAAFGLLLFVFSAGFCVSIAKLVAALRGSGGAAGHATH